MTTMRQLRRWHRKLSAAHAHACEVAEEALEALGEVDSVIIRDPTIELHAALCNIEGHIEEREASRKGHAS